MKTNFWKLLAEMGIVYGRDVVLSYEIKDFRFINVLEFRGCNFKTAKEIYESLTAKATGKA